jgi:hypothetical protein
MKKLKDSPSGGFVDLFYNDVYGLSQVIEGMQYNQNPINHVRFKVDRSTERLLVESEQITHKNREPSG